MPALRNLLRRAYKLVPLATQKRINHWRREKRFRADVGEHLRTGKPLLNHLARRDGSLAALLPLHVAIEREIKRQRSEYQHYIYTSGELYQGLDLLGIQGVRNTEERWREYDLGTIVKAHDTVLDIGCNCGFVGIHAAHATGCRVEGIDVNPHMIAIGRMVADYLGLTERVALHVGDFQDPAIARKNTKYSVILSLAAHHTKDGRHRPDFKHFMAGLVELLEPGGVIVFETHFGESRQADFWRMFEPLEEAFDWSPPRPVQKARELLLLRRRADRVNPT